MSTVVFRTMEVSDLLMIKEIEEECFSSPWSMQSYLHELTQNHFAHYIVGTLNNNIAGYCGCWLVIDEAQITTIATHPHYRKMGIGEELMRYMMTRMIENGAKTLFLEVRVTNERAKNLYRKLGFEKIGIRKKYYADNQEDAIVMGVSLDGSKKGFNRTWG